MNKVIIGLVVAVVLGAGGYFLFSGSRDPEPIIAAQALTEVTEAVLVIEIAGGTSGTVEIRLRPDLAPLHVERIVELAISGAYDGVAFHRVIDGFMAQTGDVEFGMVEGYDINRAGQGGSTSPDIPAEFSDVPYVEGIVGMARAQPVNSANSQFFIMFDAASSLNGQYTVIGEVISGMDVVHAIKRGVSPNGAVAENPDYMERVTIK